MNERFVNTVNNFARIGTRLRSMVLGQRCAVCELACSASPVCTNCTEGLLRPTRCRQCGIKQPAARVCGACSVQPPPFDALLCLGDFDDTLATLVAQLKFNHRLMLAPWMAQQLLVLLDKQSFDWVIPIPLHPARQTERGFNQAWEIARYLPYPAMPLALQRNRDTPSQRTVDAKARFANVKHAFSVNPDSRMRLKGSRVLLVDDVVTTTATVAAASAALRKAGAAHITVLCVARAGKD